MAIKFLKIKNTFTSNTIFFFQIAVVLCLFGVALSLPQNGYNYNQPAPPPAPSNLYNTPSRSPAPAPPPPQQGYGVPQASNIEPVRADQVLIALYICRFFNLFEYNE